VIQDDELMRAEFDSIINANPPSTTESGPFCPMRFAVVGCYDFILVCMGGDRPLPSCFIVLHALPALTAGRVRVVCPTRGPVRRGARRCFTGTPRRLHKTLSQVAPNEHADHRAAEGAGTALPGVVHR
jgi:hypothetical protein